MFVYWGSPCYSLSCKIISYKIKKSHNNNFKNYCTYYAIQYIHMGCCAKKINKYIYCLFFYFRLRVKLQRSTGAFSCWKKTSKGLKSAWPRPLLSWPRHLKLLMSLNGKCVLKVCQCVFRVLKFWSCIMYKYMVVPMYIYLFEYVLKEYLFKILSNWNRLLSIFSSIFHLLSIWNRYCTI